MSYSMISCVLALGLLPLAAGAASGDASQRNAAAAVANDAPQCKAIQPFYWEIGDRSGRLAGATAGGATPDAETVMPVASASKWFFGAYVAQRREGRLSDADVRALSMRSGYVGLQYGACIRLLPLRQQSETVAECLHSRGNDAFTAEDVGHFFYNGGHFQHFAAVDLGLGAMNNAALHDEIAREVGGDIRFGYDSPQLAAGMRISAADYAQFLRKLLRGELALGALLGADAVCTNPQTCPDAVSTPVPAQESWHYSLAHWVEDDPVVGDGAFSSPGAFGFYPWIDASRTYYGVLARREIGAKAYYKSVQCGRAIRKAWLAARQP
jgi:CubicO group peptidase (beta-lactamase class C family)